VLDLGVTLWLRRSRAVSGLIRDSASES
jgi:hypothetical protein